MPRTTIIVRTFEQPMSTKKRLIIHVGLPRTGTTTIQNFLSQNAEALREQGIWYPRFDAARYVETTGPADDLRAQSIISNLSSGIYHEVLAMAIGQAAKNAQRNGFHVDIKIWHDFLDNLAASDCHTAIISFEGFSSNPVGHNLESLREALSRFRFEGIVYHRRYDSWTKSLFEQNIRGKVRYKLDFEQFIETKNFALYPFSKRVELLYSNLLLEKLHVRGFEQASKGDNLLEDFFRALGLEEIWPKIAPETSRRKNASLQPSQSLVLLQLNRWGVSDAHFVEVRQALTRVSKQARGDDPCSLVSASALAHVEALAAAEAESLETLYGIAPSPHLARERKAPLPHRLSRGRFEEIIRSISEDISPQVREELLERSRELEP